MYTEIHFNSELKKNLNQNVIDILGYMLDHDKNMPALPDHEFFKCDRWKLLFTMGSYYFDADTHSTLRFDDISGSYYLCVRANLKNYNNEIQKFIDWIMPYLNKYEGEFLGFYRYEETEEPTLIYAKTSTNPYNVWQIIRRYFGRVQLLVMRVWRERIMNGINKLKAYNDSTRSR